MPQVLTTVAIRYEHDVVLARQRARQIAGLLGFDSQDQVRIATAVSEIARNAFRYAERGKAEFILAETSPPLFQIRIMDQGRGIPNLQQVLNGDYISKTGMGMGILGARRLMDEFSIESDHNGTRVLLGKMLPMRAAASLASAPSKIAAELARQTSEDPFEELQRQNQELLAALSELERRQAELGILNKELQD